ncbi:MAG: beta-lactamase family protein [Caulobacteraceae bacterium]|nr:beta-lactamase family protein [Caulobacteraceae bacterium]
MITRRPVTTTLAALGLATAARAAAAQAPGVAGSWTGVLSAGPAKLRLRLVLGADGTATLYSLDQGGAAMAGKANALAPEKIEVEIAAVGGRFAGKLVSADRIDGTWSQGGAGLPLTLKRGDAGLPKGEPLPAALPAPAPLTPELLESLRRASGSPALGAAAQRRGGQTLAWAAGLRRLGGADPVGPADKWHLGSITKSMTATLVGRLVEAGQLKWDDTVGALLGDKAPDMRPEYRAATLRHLASHRSGLPGDLPDGQLARFPRESADPREDRLAYARMALALPPKGPAGTTYEYANNGYVVLGAIIERRLDKTWEAAIRERLFEPLKLGSAGFGAPDREGPGQPSGHTAAADGVLRAFPASGPSDNPAVLGPAGRVHMTLQDLVLYLAAHRDQSPLLTPDTWRTLHTPPFGGDYAMGWMVQPNGVLWHNGSNTLWYAMAAFHPGQGVASAAAANDGRMASVAPAVELAVHDAILSAKA